MRISLSVLLALLVLASAAMAGDAKTYGKALTLKETTKISDILANPKQYKGKRVLVEGNVVDVCSKRGCWIKISSDKEFESLTFKVDDGVIVFPMDAKGKKVRAEGVMSVVTYTKEQLLKSAKKHAEEEKTAFDPSTITGPKTIIQLKGEGAVIE